MNRPPPAPRRGNRPPNADPDYREARQELGPIVNIIISMIGVSKRRCETFAEMSQKISASLVNLQMDCQRMSSYIRHDPAGLNRLGIWLNAAKNALERDQHHLDEQIQIELFLQGELERWLNGEPPTEFAPPPPGMRRLPPQMTRPMPEEMPPVRLGAQVRPPASMGGANYPPVPQPQHLLPPQARALQAPGSVAPRMPAPAPARQPQAQSEPGESLLSPAAAFAAYQRRPSVQTAAITRESLPIVRFPVQHYAPAAAEAAQESSLPGENGASHAHVVVSTEEGSSEDKSHTTPS